MQNREKNRRKKMYENITITHMLCLFAMLAAVLLSQNSSRETIYPVLNIRIILLIGFIGFIAMILYNTRLWGLNRENYGTYNELLVDLLYITFPLIIAILTLIITGKDSFHVEVVLILPVIITASVMGKKAGLVMAAISMVILIINNIYNSAGQSVYQLMEYDLILIGVIYVVGWFVGSLTNLERQHREELTLLANTDIITGLYNHRYFQEKIQECFKTSSTEAPLSLIIIDIDYFKNYNDVYGHQMGDKLLNVVGSIMKTAVKDRGFCARYGGDEFVVVLPHCSSNKAVDVAEQIRNRVNKYGVLGEEHLPEDKITISCGIAVYPDHAENIKELIKYADQALYRAKSLNRNKVELYYSVFAKLDIGEDDKELLNSIHTLVSVINAKDRYTYGHSERVTRYSLELANKMGLDEEQIHVLGYAAFLHDIGKIEIDRDILNKTGSLDDKEWDILKNHPKWGSAIVKAVKQLRPAVEIILCHHENYDGSGYPKGISGDNIPLLSRIIRVVDSFDAMISKRPYKPRMSIDEALEELEQNSGTMFDPEITALFIRMVKNEQS